MSNLDALVHIIANSVKDIESKSTERGVTYPTLGTLSTSETDNLQVELGAQADLAIAAAYQLIATLQHPRSYLANMCFWPLFTAGLAFAEAAFVPDILAQAGPKGMHVNDIASVRNVDPNKLGRTLRALASRHVFDEVSPDVFKNNRISAALCTGKAVKDLPKSPEDRWDGTDGMAAFASTSGGILLQASGSLVDNSLDPATAFSEEPNQSAFARIHNGLSCYDWLDLPENVNERKKFGIAMNVSLPEDALATTGFDWASLPAGSKVVDVGGGVGNMTRALAQVHKHLRYTVQDRPGTAKEGEKLWRSNMLDAIESGAVQFQGHDFFEEEPIKDAKVFILRYITHNWSDKYAQKILSRLRDAARPDTTLLVMDDIQDYLCRGSPDVQNIPGVAKPFAPEPLLPYAEIATTHAYGLDLGMMAAHNCQERTLGQFISLLTSAGWKLERVHRLPGPLMPQLVCVPV